MFINRLHLFSLTQQRFVLIQTITFTCVIHVLACTKAIVRQVHTKILQGGYNKNLMDPLLTVTTFHYVKTQKYEN